MTPSEFRVAELIADGLSNTQVAQALFLTKRTVEWHISHIFRKLEVVSREGIADLLGRG